MSELFVTEIVNELQLSGKLPEGVVNVYSWEQRFSFVHKIDINERCFYCKILKNRTDYDISSMKEKLINEFNALDSLYPLFKRSGTYSIPKPIYFSSERLLLITEAVTGSPVSHDIYSGMKRFSKFDDRLLDLCKRIGGCLKYFHGLGEEAYTAEDINELVEYIVKRLDTAMFSSNDHERLLKWMNDKKERVNNNIHLYKKNPSHHDLNLSNIYSDGNVVNLIDFGDYSYDHYYQDIISFQLMMDEFFISRIKYKSKLKKIMITAFSEGYGIDLSMIPHDDLYQLILLKNLSVFLKTFQYRKEVKIKFNPQTIKDRIINHFDYGMTKKAILNLIS